MNVKMKVSGEEIRLTIKQRLENKCVGHLPKGPMPMVEPHGTVHYVVNNKTKGTAK